MNKKLEEMRQTARMLADIEIMRDRVETERRVRFYCLILGLDPVNRLDARRKLSVIKRISDDGIQSAIAVHL